TVDPRALAWPSYSVRAAMYRRSARTCFYLFFIVSAAPAIYTLSLHDALPISLGLSGRGSVLLRGRRHPIIGAVTMDMTMGWRRRSEEHTSELQSRGHLVCRLLLEKKKKNAAETAVTDGPCFMLATAETG